MPKQQGGLTAIDGMQPYNLTMEWGEDDEGLYHWAGRAKDIDHAIQLAREDMDRSYNNEYANSGNKDNDDFMRRGIAAGKETTEYVMADYSEGVNEFAAGIMLEALKLINETYQLDDVDQEIVQTAIAHGEGRL